MKNVGEKRAYSYEFIKKKILNNTYEPNEAINEDKILKILKISRTPIREAILQLVQEGLVTNLHGRGFSVSPITTNYIKEILQIRVIIECGAAKEVIPFVDEEKIKKIRDSYISSKKNFLNDVNVYFKLQDQIHLSVFEMLNNKRLFDIYNGIQDHIIRIRNYLTDKIDHKRATESYKEHLKILDSLKKRDSVEAEKTIKEHLHNSMEFQISSIFKM